MVNSALPNEVSLGYLW